MLTLPFPVPRDSEFDEIRQQRIRSALKISDRVVQMIKVQDPKLSDHHF
jgi:hypothetical protein